MDIGGPYTPDTERFHVIINGKTVKPCRGEPYRFSKGEAEHYTRCTELRNKVASENIRIVPVDMV
jgi:hypothetical protein